jgi:hypothetical protein
MTAPVPAIIFRLSEALDAEIIRQRQGVTARPFDARLDLDAERLARVAFDAFCEWIKEGGFPHVYRFLRDLLR